MNERKICLIGSYAKSGSNWARMVLENYLADGDAPVSIWSASRVFNGIRRSDFEYRLKIPSWLLDQEEIWELLPAYFREAARTTSEPLYYKIHNANTPNREREALFSPKQVKGAVYLVRHPFDVAVSFSHHFGLSYDEAIRRLADREAVFTRTAKVVIDALPARSLSWSEHVASWLDERRFPVELIRYEELLREPLETFSRMVATLIGPVSEARLAKAIEFSSLAELRRQEREEGAAFNNHRAGSFFRKGASGTWSGELSAGQTAAITRVHGEAMERLGYLDRVDC